LADVEGRAAELGDRERTAFVGVESWLARVAAPDAPAEVIPQELSRPGALSEALDRPLLYVRGELDGFAGAERLTSTLAESHKDAVLLCLKEPPKSRTEAGLIESVHLAYGGGPPLEARTPRALRLAELPRSLRCFEAAWADGVRSADSFQRIADLRSRARRLRRGEGEESRERRAAPRRGRRARWTRRCLPRWRGSVLTSFASRSSISPRTSCGSS
jgi:hypothetical protein